MYYTVPNTHLRFWGKSEGIWNLCSHKEGRRKRKTVVGAGGDRTRKRHPKLFLTS
jgi:hypothetical protein